VTADRARVTDRVPVTDRIPVTDRVPVTAGRDAGTDRFGGRVVTAVECAPPVGGATLAGKTNG